MFFGEKNGGKKTVNKYYCVYSMLHVTELVTEVLHVRKKRNTLIHIHIY
jgi:hypothetical protein